MIRSRQLILILSLIGVLLLSVTGAAAQERGGGDHGRDKPVVPRIVWSPASVNQAVAPGQTVQVSVTFTSNINLSNVALRIPGMLGRVMKAEPGRFASLTANTPTTVTFTIQMPATRTEGIGGAVQVVAGNRVIPNPLPVRLPLAAPSA